jgi:hypothetical protein
MKQNKIPKNEYIIQPKGKTNPYKHDVIYSDLGQWKYPGQVTRIPSNQITMQGVPYPVEGVDDTGYSQMMYPGMDYTFPGNYVTEYPQMQIGGLIKKGLSAAKKVVKQELPNTKRLWRIENPNIKFDPSKVANGNAQQQHLGNWFSDDINYVSNYLRKNQKVPGSRLVEVNVPESELSKYHISNYENMKDVEPRNWLIPNDAFRNYTDLSHLPISGGNLSKIKENQNYIKELVNKKIAEKRYGGDPSLTNIEGHYPFGGQNTKTHTHMAQGGGLNDLPKAQDGLLNTLYAKLNPYNWGVKDYSGNDEVGKWDWSTANYVARANKHKEFMHNNKRYAVKDKRQKENWETAEETNPDFFKNYALNYLKKIHPKDYEKRYKDLLNLHYRYGNPYVNVEKPYMNEKGDYGRANFDNSENQMRIYGVNQNPNITKIDTADLIDDYVQELLHARQLKDLGKESFSKHQEEDLKRNNVYYDRSTKKWINYDEKLYNDPKSIEGVHYTQGYALKNRLLNRDYNLEEKPVDKEYRHHLLKYFQDKTFHPYEDQDDLRTLQKALSEAGYDMSESLKKDGTYDGIYGEQTKYALDNWQKGKLHVPNIVKKSDKVLTAAPTYNKQMGGWLDELPEAQIGRIVKAGLKGVKKLNPVRVADKVIPQVGGLINPAVLMGVESMNAMSMSPLNWIPGYGQKLKGTDQAFRKFGNSIDDVIERQALSPKGGMFINEGNWAAMKAPNEKYSGVFLANMNPEVKGSNIKLSGIKGREGVVGTTRDGNVDIPLNDEGLSFYRRLPFSNKYTPINKEKLIKKEFDLARTAPHLQSLAEKALGAAGVVAVHDYMQEDDKSDWFPQIKNQLDKSYNKVSKYVGPYLPKEEYGGWLDAMQKGGISRDNTSVRKPNTLNPTELANAQPYRKLSKEEQMPMYVDSAIANRQPDVLRKTEKQGMGSKAHEVVMNPFTAATNLYQHGRLPDNFSQGETNALDFAVGAINPLTYLEAAYNTGKAVFDPQTYKDLGKTAGLAVNALSGDQSPDEWKEAGLNTLFKGLDASMAKGAGKMVSKNAKRIINTNINKTSKNIKKGLEEQAGKYYQNIQPNKYGGLIMQEGGEPIKISDNRKIRATTGKKINPNKDLKTGWYDRDVVDSIAENAIRRGVNPYQAIAMGLIESNLGGTDYNVGHVMNFDESISPYKQMMDKIITSQFTAKRLNKKNDADIIQAYNGYGKLFPNTEKDYHGHSVKAFYGVPVDEKGIDLKKNPLYGKEVLDIQKNIIEKDPNIKNIITSYLYPRMPRAPKYSKDWSNLLPQSIRESVKKEIDEEDISKAARDQLKQDNLMRSNNFKKRGGQKGLKKYTSKNIQSSVNDIMLRNETLFGPAGKKRYKPGLKYKSGGGWLDNLH